MDSVPSPVCNRNPQSNVKEPQIAALPNASTIHLQAGACNAERESLERNEYSIESFCAGWIFLFPPIAH